MMKLKNIGLVLCCLFTVSLMAQQKDGTRKKQRKNKVVQEAPVDTIAMDMEGVEQIELLESPGQLEDSPAILVKVSDKYNLSDRKDAAKYDKLWLKELYDNQSLFDSIYNTVTELEVDSIYHYDLDTETLKARLKILDQKTPFNIAYNPSLENVIKTFLTRKRGFMQRMLKASQFYFPMFEQELDNNNVPLELKYLAVIESALNPRAKSRVGATGLWQFMYGTGKMYNLDVSSYVDERSDPIASTKAAAKYLSRLHGIFNDWDLALAAYNSGPGNVNKAIRRSGGYTNYWNIRRNLPRETAGYVPAFLAAMYIFEYAEEHGLQRVKIERPFFDTDTVHVKSLITFNQISELVDVSVEELKVLNPSYKLDVIPYVEGKNYVLRLPREAMGKFVNNENAIYAHVKTELETEEKPLAQLVNAEQRIVYRVKSGDYLGRIAERHGVGVSQIKQWNGLRGNTVRIGQRLTIYTKNSVASNSSARSSNSSTKSAMASDAKVHTVKSGDSLWTISKKYPGITIDNLREWNGIRGNDIKIGAKLKLCSC
ncbi:lytic transglycosylase domain-containing protein [Sediminicola sp. 1XM1-17]|uniref:lytic transglycosylase domain-containing protein n=1 Tax=Sediminicola sp. 1XM1-17 TaxID=3127702 RepID=UPI0030779997